MLPHHVNFKLPLVMLEYPHILHLCGFARECVLLCVLRLPESAVFLLTLSAMVQFFLSVLLYACFEVGRLVA